MSVLFNIKSKFNRNQIQEMIMEMIAVLQNDLIETLKRIGKIVKKKRFDFNNFFPFVSLIMFLKIKYKIIKLKLYDFDDKYQFSFIITINKD
jgi:hypothetical protein